MDLETEQAIDTWGRLARRPRKETPIQLSRGDGNQNSVFEKQ